MSSPRLVVPQTTHSAPRRRDSSPTLQLPVAFVPGVDVVEPPDEESSVIAAPLTLAEGTAARVAAPRARAPGWMIGAAVALAVSVAFAILLLR